MRTCRTPRRLRSPTSTTWTTPMCLRRTTTTDRASFTTVRGGTKKDEDKSVDRSGYTYNVKKRYVLKWFCINQILSKILKLGKWGLVVTGVGCNAIFACSPTTPSRPMPDEHLNSEVLDPCVDSPHTQAGERKSVKNARKRSNRERHTRKASTGARVDNHPKERNHRN